MKREDKIKSIVIILTALFSAWLAMNILGCGQNRKSLADITQAVTAELRQQPEKIEPLLAKVEAEAKKDGDVEALKQIESAKETQDIVVMSAVVAEEVAEDIYESQYDEAVRQGTDAISAVVPTEYKPWILLGGYGLAAVLGGVLHHRRKDKEIVKELSRTVAENVPDDKIKQIKKNLSIKAREKLNTYQ